jgi:hypothetical protein
LCESNFSNKEIELCGKIQKPHERMSGKENQVVIALYRALLRSARRFDRNPAWKAFIASKPREQYGKLRDALVESCYCDLC